MKRILVVEDNEINMKLCREIIRYGGYEMIEARDGNEAIEKAMKEMPNLICMDIQLPGMDGVTAMKKMKEYPELKDIPVIALTSYAMPGDKERFLSEGFDDYISKPMKVQEVLETIKKYL